MAKPGESMVVIECRTRPEGETVLFRAADLYGICAMLPPVENQCVQHARTFHLHILSV